MNLIIDIGNSVAKLAVFHQGEMIDMVYDTNHSLDKLENICERYAIRRGILSSVIHLNDIVESQLKHLDFPLLRLDYKTPLPITNLYRTPKTLGSDRIAAVVGAYTRFPGRDILVVDAGTALTYEFIDHYGCYHGGNISLGKYTRIKALSAYCDKLPVINPNGDIPDFGYSTETAIRAGVIHGIELEIMGYIQQPDILAQGIAVAFVSTLYGVGFANLLFLPIAGKLKMNTREKILLCNKIIFALLFMMITGVALAQNGVNSPYTRYGFGQLSDQSTTANRGMGGISYGLRNKLINVGNPASYSAIDSITFLFDAGISLQNANFSSGDLKMNAKNSSLDYIALQFRLRRKIGLTAGLIPFSNINYSFTGEGREVPNPDGSQGSNTYSYESFSGDGGLHQAFLGIGVELFKNFSIGANISYLYGDYTHTITNTYSNSSAWSNVRNYQADISTYKLDFGAQYSFTFKDKHAFTLGAVYSMGHDINNAAYKVQQMQSSSTVMQQSVDTIRNAFELPQKLGFGLTYVYDNRLTVGVDYTMQQWSGMKFPHFQANPNSDIDSGSSENDYEQWQFKNLSRISVGAEYVPNPVGRNFFKRLHYRVGAYYTTPYIQVKNSDMREFGVEGGVAIPIMNRYNNRSLLSVTAQYINVSPKSGGLIKENYLRINIGFTFNEDWFRKMLVQ